jgi:hypothetical protein
MFSQWTRQQNVDKHQSVPALGSFLGGNTRAAQRTAACYAVSIDVGAQGLLELRLPGHGTLHRQHLLPGAQTESDAVGTRCGLQRPERAGLVRIAVAVGHVSRTFRFDQHPQRVSRPINRAAVGFFRLEGGLSMRDEHRNS